MCFSKSWIHIFLPHGPTFCCSCNLSLSCRTSADGTASSFFENFVSFSSFPWDRSRHTANNTCICLCKIRCETLVWDSQNQCANVCMRLCQRHILGKKNPTVLKQSPPKKCPFSKHRVFFVNFSRINRSLVWLSETQCYSSNKSSIILFKTSVCFLRLAKVNTSKQPVPRNL